MPVSDGTQVILSLLDEYRQLRKLNLKKQPISLMEGVPKRAQPLDPVRAIYKKYSIRTTR